MIITASKSVKRMQTIKGGHKKSPMLLDSSRAKNCKKKMHFDLASQRYAISVK